MKKREFFCKSIALVFLLSLGLSYSVIASKGSGTVNVSRDMHFSLAKAGITRTGRYSVVLVKANSVYPLDGSTDRFRNCRTRLYGNGYAISGIYVLHEGQDRYIPINEGSLNITNFNLYFSGNDPNYPAGISYCYDGR